MLAEDRRLAIRSFAARPAKPIRPQLTAITARSKAAELPAHEIWWRLLLARVAGAKSFIPAELNGVVAIEITRNDGTIESLHLLVDGPRTAGFRGTADHARTHVSTSERELASVLGEEVAPRGALRVSGDVSLFRGLLVAIAQAPKPRSLLALRGGK